MNDCDISRVMVGNEMEIIAEEQEIVAIQRMAAVL